jgi:cobaltochelatase CobN
MHLLNTTAGEIADGEEAIDLKQSPGDLVVLSAADSDLACLSRAAAARPEGSPKLRLVNLLRLKHPMSVDLYVERVIGSARFVCIRLIGGRSYWLYGLEEIHRVCRQRKVPLAVLLEEQEDPDGMALSTVSKEARERIGAYLHHGGIDNARQLLAYGASLAGFDAEWREPTPLLEAGLYWPGERQSSLDELKRRWQPDAPVAALLFYRALVASGGTQAVDAMIEGLQARGLNPLPIHVLSLKNPFANSLIDGLFASVPPDVILNATGFATSAPGKRFTGKSSAPVLQLVFAAISRTAWAESTRGLTARDLAMNVALPEVDGRLFAGAVAFKAEERFDPLTECPLVGHDPDPAGVAYAAELAANWANLRRTAPADRKVALILANYPNRDGRLGNGVGLDTPASTAAMLQAMKKAGYDVGEAPETGKALMDYLRAGTTNAEQREAGEFLPLCLYRALKGVTERWGPPEDDPFFDKAANGFRLPLHRFGNVVVGVQPARGYNIDPKSSYHDPALPPPHGYLAFYQALGAQVVIHAGKHGNLEWLPGKALALSEDCFPRAIAGAVPQLYPFIVNDPGEGTQAKRRIGAAIIDHLTPPLTRAESYGPLKALEALVDEYYLAAGLDPRRRDVLRDDILELARSIGLDSDCGMTKGDQEGSLAALDNYLCDLKELQIRDGLHVFGSSPAGRLRSDLLVALLRVPRRSGDGGDASLLRAMAKDLGLDFDPLDCRMGDDWTGPKPDLLAALDDQLWRSCGDTVERLELLAQSLVSGGSAPGNATQAVLETLAGLEKDVDACGAAEMDALLTGLDGRFIAPGPSGAPTRGRPEVLPTGRNFYSVDTRAVPTPSAWHLGWKSAQLLVEEHLQRHGDYPRAIAITAWGTANMRTGGDDIAQALALMGTRPTWEGSTGRVTGFEILPATVLGRPRVDVTVRISGFFRDAFAEQIDLIASAASAVMRLDESPDVNPAAARFRAEGDEIRVFGSRPGAYGAGLQAMIDEKLWGKAEDLAEAYLLWGSYAYGGGREGEAARGGLERRLAEVDAVVQNQDNREHDLLDSDDYYQFEGGLFAAVKKLKGTAPAIYHNDHSRPESPKIRTLDDEIARIVRGRLVNPKWIQGVMRHGYKGAFEIAASVDYLFAFAATTGMVRDHHFELVYDAFIKDRTVRDFMRDENPDALRETAARLSEAIDRGLWRPKSNSAGAALADLSQKEAT